MDKYQKLILINQFEILKRLSDNDDERESYDEKIEILSSGYKCCYDDLWRPISEDIGESITSFVYDVLNMYDALDAYRSKNTECKLLDGYYGSFIGFDARDEMDYYSFTIFLCKKNNYQPLLADKAVANNIFDRFNTHSAMVQKYTDMLSEWKLSKDKLNLTVFDIKRILKIDKDAN